MKHAQPQGLSRWRVKELIAQAEPHRSTGSRIDVLSRQFLGLPYQINPLIGSAATPEVFTASLEGFDCVTYIETIHALSRSSSVDEFVEWLRKIRYQGGQVAWKRRNHYMTGWIRNNARTGALRRLSLKDVPAIVKRRTLDSVPGLPQARARFQCVPKTSIRKLGKHLQTGDLIFFASTRKHLDIFHCGILVRDGDRLLIRHASRSRGNVVEQELNEFLKANRMAGVIVVRPAGGDAKR